MKLFVKILSSLYLLALLALCQTDLWPARLWWFANLLLIAPLWPLYLPPLAGIIYGIRQKSRSVVITNCLAALVVLFGIMGWNIPFASFFQPRHEKTLTILTANLGEGARMSSLRAFVGRQDPDILLLQESGDWVMKFFKESRGNWYTYFHDGFGIMSRYKILDTDLLSGKKLNDSGTFMVEYLLEGPHGPLHVFNVHLETPRKGVEPILDRGLKKYKDMIQVTQRQERESSQAAKWIGKRSNAVIAGDFNIVAANPIFRRYWSKYQDAFSKAGWGFGYTKFTGWYGARIDHVLADPNWQVQGVDVGPDLGGDHRPFVVRLAFTGEPEPLSQALEGGIVGNPLSPQDIYYYEDFESVQTGILKLPLAEWPMELSPTVRFSYKIAPGSPVAVRVLTPFNDWICLGGTASAECPHTKSGEYFTLADDDQWHKIEINVDRSVKSVLKSLNGIKEWQFFIPEGQPGREYWIENFTISK